jgi:hypothetical protein
VTLQSQKPPRTMMGIASPTGSHLPVLEQYVREAGDGLIIEHGAGLYSTVLLARLGCRVVCMEPHKGWAEWARWVYEDRVEVIDSMPATIALLPKAAVVFLDGPAKARGVLLQSCLDAGVPTIIVHDTNKREWRFYDFKASMFEDTRYDVTHHAEDSHRTTLWKRKVAS